MRGNGRNICVKYPSPRPAGTHKQESTLLYGVACGTVATMIQLCHKKDADILLCVMAEQAAC